MKPSSVADVLGTEDGVDSVDELIPRVDKMAATVEVTGVVVLGSWKFCLLY